MISQQSDAGRMLNENNDCSVVALAHSTGMSYEEAHKLAAKFGRRNRRGMKTTQIATMLDSIGGRNLEVAKPVRQISPFTSYNYYVYGRRPRRVGTSVERFIRTLPKKGRFYLCCTTHAFAYVDGVVLDNLRRPLGRANMYLAYEVPLSSSAKPEAKPDASPLTQGQINELWERLNKLEASWK